MSRSAQREQRADGIPASHAGYQQARMLNAQHGRTFYLATLLLPAAKRPYVHALYGFARYADELVDRVDPAVPAAERSARFATWCDQVLAELEWGATSSPIVRAVLDTVQRWDLPQSYFAD